MTIHRALSVRLPVAGSDRTTCCLDTGDYALIWVESLFDPSAVRAQHALLRRAVVTRAGVPLRDVTRVYVRPPNLQRANSIVAPTSPFCPIERRLRRLITGFFLLVILLDLIAFALQHLLG